MLMLCLSPSCSRPASRPTYMEPAFVWWVLCPWAAPVPHGKAGVCPATHSTQGQHSRRKEGSSEWRGKVSGCLTSTVRVREACICNICLKCDTSRGRWWSEQSPERTQSGTLFSVQFFCKPKMAIFKKVY